MQYLFNIFVDGLWIIFPQNFNIVELIFSLKHFKI